MRNVPGDPAGSGHAEIDAVVAESKPLTARSVVASTLLGVDPPRLPARLLVRSGELFGISQGTTRVAISRMTANGELEADDNAYRLAGRRFASRASRQAISRSGARRAWDGDWTLIVVTADEREAADRTALRRSATALRFAERREGVWMRPHNLLGEHDDAQPDAVATIVTQCDTYVVRPLADPARLASELFDLVGWAERARLLLAAIGPLTRSLADDDLEALRDAFVVSAATLRHLQVDPLLPDELLPHGWPGIALRADYERFDTVFKTAWAKWFSAQP